MKILHTFSKGAALLAVMAMVACDPQMNEKPEIGPTPTAEQVLIAVSKGQSDNHVKFVDNTPGSFNSIWDLGNGQTLSGKEVVGIYPTKGEYTVKLTVLTKGGQATSTKKITIAKTDPTLLDIPAYNMLTGGVSMLGGKTWVVASFLKGHLGVGPAAGETPEWWSAGPDDKKGLDFYDDEMTFALDGFGFQYKNNGKSFTLGFVTGSGDQAVDYTPPTGMTWSMSEKDGKWFLSVSDAFLALNAGTKKYQVLEMSENLISLKLLEAKDGNAWYLKLVPKGFKPELPPVPVKPYEARDIFEGFDEDGVTIKSWNKQMGNGSFDEFYDNPDPAAPNTSAKVARYRRGTDFEWANVQSLLPYKMDLTKRNKFTIKVFVPGSNKMSADKMTVALKLQDSDKGGNAWQNQHEVKLPITKFNEWVEYTFDFSSSKDRKDFDQIVLQLGSEGHFEGGTFYVDDLKLL